MFTDAAPFKSQSFPEKPSSTMPPRDLTISVTLTSRKNPFDRRQITLTTSESCIIGRASRSKDKLEATSNNALFDCPVVSREHAALKAHLWAPTGDQVTITDLGSMHGTRVNGTLLQRGKSWTLRNGDVLQFGERVSRGEDTHEGVIVTFDRTPTTNTQYSHTFAASQPNGRGYYVPDISDDEDSDSPVDEALYKISDDEFEKQPSSAQTTPEQAKATPGSAERPIDLDAPRPYGIPQVIDFEDDDGILMPPPPKPSVARQSAETPQIFSSQKVVQDSIDRDNSLYGYADVTSVPLLQSNRDYMPSMSRTTLDDAEQYGIDEPGSPSDDESSEQIDGVEYGQGEEVEGRSDEENADYDHDEDYPSDEDSPFDVDDGDNDEEPELLSPVKAPSPELGSTRGYEALSLAAQSKTASHSKPASDPFSPPKAASQPHAHYDPVRGSQASPQHTYKPNYSFGYPAPLGRDWAPERSSTYTYDRPLPSWSTFDVDGGADYLRSSRWDIGPTSPLPPPPISGLVSRQPPPPVFGYNAIAESYDWLDKPRLPLQHSPSIEPLRIDGNQPYGFQHSWDPAPPVPNYQDPWSIKSLSTRKPVIAEATTRSFERATTSVDIEPSATAASALKNRISITDIVDDAAVAGGKLTEARKESKSTSTKRKAAEMSSNTAAEAQIDGATDLPDGVTIEQSIGRYDGANVVEQPVAEAEAEAEEPPARRRRVGRVEDVHAPAGKRVMEVAKFTGSAMLGGVATMAFLCSPLAEKALEWLA